MQKGTGYRNRTNKTTYSKETLSMRPGAKSGCDRYGCGHKFLPKEQFIVRETKLSWFLGDDEVEFLCNKCILKQAPQLVLKRLKLTPRFKT